MIGILVFVVFVKDDDFDYDGIFLIFLMLFFYFIFFIGYCNDNIIDLFVCFKFDVNKLYRNL